MYKLKFIIAGCILVLATSCANDSEDDLISIVEDQVGGEEEGEGNPPSTAITYANTIEGIMDSSCVECHANPPRNGAPFACQGRWNIKCHVKTIWNSRSYAPIRAFATKYHRHL